MKRCFAVAISSLILSISVFLVTSCTYVTPEAENPNPELLSTENCAVREGVLSCKKSFFGYQIGQESLEVTYTPKTYLCGWAPVTQSGQWRGAFGLSNTPYRSRHCNVEMRISKDGKSLIGKMVDLNYPNDFESWEPLFSINITQHYYYEKDVDSRGRELNKYKKVTDRGTWKVRPWIDLDLSNIEFHDIFRRPYGYWGGKILDTFDVETSVEDGKTFIGFSGVMTHGRYGNLFSHTYRFNFLEIKDNPNFIPTPYNTRNAKHMNILHILGYQPTGNRAQEVNWAAHWDLSKPVEFCLNSFPDDNRDYNGVAVEVIDEMNKAMTKIGAVPAGQKAFVISDKKYKYDFDLRCPAITWVDDPILSFRAPLGIGLVNTNIKTGEILWGGAVIWGGLIDYIVNRDSESTADALARETHSMLQEVELAKHNPYFEDLSSQLRLTDWSVGFTNLKDIVESANSKDASVAAKERQLQQIAESIAGNISQEEFNEMDQSSKDELFRTLISQLQDIDTIENLNVEGYDLEPLSLSDDDLVFDTSYAQADESDFISDLSRFAGLTQDVSYSDEEKESRNIVQGTTMTMEKAEELVMEFLSDQSLAYDADNRIENHFDAVSNAVSGMTGMEKLKASKSMIKNVTLHEFGHVVGLGHQFEGNRMPEKGMVPPKVYNELAAEVEDRFNYSSIMDYMSGHTEVSLPIEKVKMGTQDELTLTYLYKQQYSSYKSGDEDWTFHSVPENGVIPNQTGEYQTRYMPQCSDFDAWLATSPYCRRWDRGHDAPTMVEENLKEYTDSFISRLNSFTEATGGNPFWARYRLWWSTYNLMNYNRTFYDNMRYQLSNNDLYRSVFDKIKKDEDALLSFSKACIDPSMAPNNRLGIEFTKLAIQPMYAESGVNTLESMQAQQTNSSYRAMYAKYKSILGEVNTRELDDEGFVALEAQLNENGLAYTEVQKLCRASKKSLDISKLLLSLKGPDHPVMNYDAAIVPTGLRGGEATSDYSRVFGTYDQLGLLPVKIAALDVLTATSSTLRFWWWRVGKPIYNDSNEGKYGYFSMYPEEFTDIVGTAVKNNMGFGGTQLQDSATMSLANLYMRYFLFRTYFWSNDNQARGFNTNFIEDLKAQTKFRVQVAPVLLESIDIPGEPSNKRFGFRPRLFNFAQRKIIDLPEAYALPDKKVIVRGNDSQIILPLTKMRFLSQEAAYVWALEVTYDKTSYDDPLQGFTVKNAIAELTTQELDKCITGQAGLATFFNTNEEFTGFQIDPSIAVDPDAQTNFEKSLNDAFEAYQSREGLTPTQWGCEESLNGVGLISSTALSLNGWYLPHIYEYIKK